MNPSLTLPVQPPTLEIIDVTSKHLCIEVEDEKVDGASRLSLVVEKGTPFPTDEPYARQLYTREANQQQYKLPVYEVEAVDAKQAEAAPKTTWEHVGIVINDRVAHGPAQRYARDG